MDEFSIREATTADTDILVHHRLGMYVGMGTDPAEVAKLARLLMQTMIAWCREQGYKTVALHTSDEGRPLHESLGFVPTNEMRLLL
jgi:hypothetical protein